MQHLQIPFLVLCHKVDVPHIGIETCPSAKEIHHDRNGHHCDQKLQRSAFLLAGLGEDRQENKHEYDRSGQHQRAEESQILHRHGIQPDEAQESGDCGDVADQQWLDHFLKVLPRTHAGFQAVHKMQRIIHGDANDHRRDSDDDDRHTVPAQGDASNGKKPAESDRDHNPKDVREAFVCDDKQQTDKEQGQRNGQYAVLFDLCSVGDGYQRRTHSGD